MIEEIRGEINIVPEDNEMIAVVKILLAMQQTLKIKHENGVSKTGFWVDCFNTSEVTEGLAAYWILKKDSEESYREEIEPAG